MVSVEQARKELERRKAEKELQRRSLLYFFKGMWKVLEPSTELHMNWHIELLCEYLELVHEGTIKKLLLNLAPRHGKSRLVSVAFPCWEWLNEPHMTYLCLSYATSLAIDLNQERQKVIQSDWYQDLSNGLTLRRTKNRMTEFENDKAGVIRARGFDGSVTGAGGLRIMCLPYNTMLHTTDGDKLIGEIVENKLDVLVATFNHETDCFEYSKILRYEKSTNDQLIDITTDDHVIRCTPEHPIYLPNKDRYVAAEWLMKGFVLLDSLSKKQVIRSVKRISIKPETVYNIATINHNYFANGLLVHNCDDPNNPTTVESDVTRDKTTKLFKDYAITRKNDPEKSAVVVIQQCTHENDVSGVIKSQMKNDYVKLILPTVAEKDEVITFPKSGRIVHRKVGDLLDPERFTQKDVDEARRDLGEYVFSCRYQQNPMVQGGGMFKRKNWVLYARKPLTFSRVFLSADCSLKDLKTSDYVVIQVWGQKAVKNLFNKWEWDYYLLYQRRERLAYMGTERAIIECVMLYPEINKKLIEDKANGPAVIDALNRRFKDSIVPINPGNKGKEVRASVCVPIHERGSILLPIAEDKIPVLDSLGVNQISVEDWWKLYPPDDYSSPDAIPVHPMLKCLEDQNERFIEEFAKFPNSAYDDQVDAFSQGITWGETFTPGEPISGDFMSFRR